jgi:uncharacterized protein YciI
MKVLTSISLLLILFGCQPTQDNQDLIAEEEPVEEVTSSFDQQLADELGADEYGMKPFVMAYLKRGPNRDQDSVTAANLQRAHLDNIGKMAEAGDLVLAGPFMDDGDVRGIYIFNVETIAEAEALTNTDPAIQAGRLEMELHQWYGPAALQMILDFSRKITKTDI